MNLELQEWDIFDFRLIKKLCFPHLRLPLGELDQGSLLCLCLRREQIKMEVSVFPTFKNRKWHIICKAFDCSKLF